MVDEEKEGMSQEKQEVGDTPALRQEDPQPLVQAPMTREAFVGELEKLVGRARAAGVRPLQELALNYMKNMAASLEAVFASLDEDNDKDKKKKTRD